MSEDDTHQKTETHEADASEKPRPLDASLKVAARNLSQEELDFAKAMGFGEDGNVGASNESQTAAPDVSPTPAGDDNHDQGEHAETEADEQNVADAGTKESAESAEDESVIAAASAGSADRDDAPPEPASDSEAPHANWEEIHPRPAAEGNQATLQARADQVLERDEGPVRSAPFVRPAKTAPSIDEHALATLQAELEGMCRGLTLAESKLSERDTELDRLRIAFQNEVGNQAADDKQLEGLRSEAETLERERDELIDQLATSSSQLIQSQGKAEKLEASLRAARGALIPLPEGERALRAEVLGLRGRLEDLGEENIRLASDVSCIATELAIATARAEDRQHEIDFHTDAITTLEKALAAKDREFEETIARHRDMIELSTRLQAENTELRSIQAALEETLQARDLEINAREEHLRVTRRGLEVRDSHLAEANDRLERERHRSETLEADLHRGDLERSQLAAKVARREVRIAALTETLGRIDDAIGERIVGPARTPSAGPD